jgi:hypothetical protein
LPKTEETLVGVSIPWTLKHLGYANWALKAIVEPWFEKRRYELTR